MSSATDFDVNEAGPSFGIEAVFRLYGGVAATLELDALILRADLSSQEREARINDLIDRTAKGVSNGREN